MTRCALALLLLLFSSSAWAVTARYRYEAAYDNVADGDWYRDSNNETATLAWGQSYVMMSLAAMFRATGHPVYLERLAYHIDGVLAQRDDVRAVTDYRGVSAACWQNRSYQPDDEPYCYVVHSGMLGYPIVEYARLVGRSGLEDELGADGERFGDKATRYLAAAQEVVAAHDDQWREAGYYVFRPDATFLTYAGRDLPLNQSNAMGRMLLALADLTGEEAYLTKATALAERFVAQIDWSGGYARWNYWGEPYSPPGEDVSHASINVDFAVEAGSVGIVFTPEHLEAMADTFLDHVYVSDLTMADFLGGGSHNGSSYRPQVGRWLRLAPYRTAVYAAARDLYEQDYPPESIGSGSLLLSWALLAELEPPSCQHFFYSVDWHDPDPEGQGDWRQATAYGANVLTIPPNLGSGCLVPLEVDAPRATEVQQWDGDAYHTVCRWEPTGGPTLRHIPYDTRHPFEYWRDGVLFQLADAFVEGEGILVREAFAMEEPTITSVPPEHGRVESELVYTAQGTGHPPLWWGLSQAPRGARIDPSTGELRFVPSAAGEHRFVVLLENDVGEDEQVFDFIVSSTSEDADVDISADADVDASLPDGDTDADSASDSGFDAPLDARGDVEVRDSGLGADADGVGSSPGCSCRGPGGAGSVLPLFWSLLDDLT